MAAAFIKIDPTKPRSARILQALRAVREARAILNQEIAAAVQAIDGDTAQPAQFDVWASEIGAVAVDYVDANTAARAGYLELSSLASKLNAGAGVGDATGAAIDQACAKFGV